LLGVEHVLLCCRRHRSGCGTTGAGHRVKPITLGLGTQIGCIGRR
jgi:hypothetical protein